jgi:aminoglycoside phosphotransferase (APT) family kinase protein
MSDDMRGRLDSYYAHAFPAKQGVRVTELAEISAGWESDMYSFTVESGPAGARQREELILRIYPGDDAHSKSAREYRGMSLLYGAGYPVPQVLVLEREDSPFGRPFVIMEKIQGQMMWPVWFGSPGEKQQDLLTLFCRLFVELHRLEWQPFADAQDRPFEGAQDRSSKQDTAGSDSGSPYTYADRELGRLRPFLARFPIPGFLPIVEWLEQRWDLVPCERPSVIHWDYHPGNILLGDDGSAVVVDWTQVDVSDSRFDLAWTLLLLSTYEGEVWHKRILHEYERLAGAKVEQLAFFEVFACLKRLGSIAASLTYGPEALGMRPGAGATMVQQMGPISRVYDRLLKRTGIAVPEVEELLAQSF